MGLLLAAVIFAVLGVIVMALPFYFTMTGACLLAVGIAFAVAWWCARKEKRAKWKTVILLAVGVGAIFLEAAVGMIYGTGEAYLAAAPNADYAVVLGAQVRGTEPSLVLATRLDAAIAYYEQNPAVTLVVSGGQGADEGVTEARAMQRYLIARGVPEAQIVMEGESRSTLENLLFSSMLIDSLGGDPTCFAIITSDFHTARTRYIAATLGITPLSCAAATRPWIYKMNYELREVFAFAKAFYVATTY